MISYIMAFMWGMVEFRSDWTRHYGYPLIEAYDRGRDLAHKLTFRHWDFRSMSMDMYDVEWRCGCGATNPDYDDQCNMCGMPRYLDDEDASSINDNESPSYRDSMNDAGRGHLLG